MKAPFNLPGMPYPETCQICGALEIAAELNLSLPVFRLLLDAGAMPQNPDEPILDTLQIRCTDGPEIVELVRGAHQARMQSSSLDDHTPPVKRPHSMRRF